MYKYYSMLRPVSIGTAPKLNEAVEIVNFDNRVFIEELGREAWGYVVYDKPIVRPEDWDLERSYR